MLLSQKKILVAVDQSDTTPSAINASFDVANGDGELKEEIEDMMRIELRDMIKNKASQQEIDAKIAAIDAKLTEAYAKVLEFPFGATLTLTSLVGVIIVTARLKGYKLSS